MLPTAAVNSTGFLPVAGGVQKLSGSPLSWLGNCFITATYMSIRGHLTGHGTHFAFFEGRRRPVAPDRHPTMTTEEERGAFRSMMTLADEYLTRYGCGFDAYMALQRALMLRHFSRGGTNESWCARFAPVFRRRYAPIFSLPIDIDLS